MILLLNQKKIETLGSCCGHGRYPSTILIRYNSVAIVDLFTGKLIPRKRNFYRTDSDGYYYLPEISDPIPPTSKPSKVDHGHKWMPIMYANFYGILKDVAEKHGYALTLHGSLSRDLDLVAIPWIQDAGDPKKMLKEMSKAIGSSSLIDVGGWEKKPHGRIAYTINSGGGGYVDISVIQPKI